MIIIQITTNNTSNRRSNRNRKFLTMTLAKSNRKKINKNRKY